MPDKQLPPGNPLASAPIGLLMVKFAVPSIVSFLVSALYNIVDQIFIGQGVGMLGNAATNVAFPLTTISTSLALLIGVGSASNINLEMGAGNRARAGRIAGSGILLLGIAGVVLAAVVLVFLQPLIRAFGATQTVLEYALTYTGITSLGIPFFIFTTGGSHIIRADGSPAYSMLCMLSGALLNTVLDPLFIFTFGMGIAGAALATVIGQAASALLVVRYYCVKFKTVRLTRSHLTVHGSYLKVITALGAASCVNQLAMTTVQITMNNTLTKYGALSVYGGDIPLACVGVISKVMVLYMAFALGISQSCQPICGFNYGAKNFARVKKTYFTAICAVTAISSLAFLCFQFFPRQIVSIFGQGSELYYQFAQRYFRIFMMMTFLNGIQPVTATFFTSIGKATRGIFLSLTRQILFLLPLILLFPRIFGIDGVMYAGPIADTAAVILAVVLVVFEMRGMGRAEGDAQKSAATA